MKEDGNAQMPIHLTEEELLGKLPERIGKVKLDYGHYPGEDLYSDGTIEEEILSIVKTRSKVEFPQIIEEKKSWPILYHLSPLRGNILDWVPMDSHAKVLEIGSGCGAITEKLAEKAGHVTCVDLSARRSQINAYRNQDRDHIEIFVGNFKDIEPELPCDYDYACMIGVFEYGQAYIDTKTPYEDFLKIMQKHVKNSGCILIAIENKYGLKYWAGCKEDHLGTYFSGLEGYPDGGNARTFTRKGLERIFYNCGIEDYSFYYPYPDYKFATTLFSDRRPPRQGELTDNMRNFDRDRLLLFHEKYVFDGIAADELFDMFSNSYLAVIGKAPEITYVKYSNDRAAAYAIRTEIINTNEGKKVRKVSMNSSAKLHISHMDEYFKKLSKRYEGSGLTINPCTLSDDGTYAEFPFEAGVTLEELLDCCLEQDDFEGFYQLFDQYYKLISFGEGLEISDYDLIFSNILVDGDKWTVIDYEWAMDERVSAREIAFRAIYCYVLAEEKRNKLNLELIMEKLSVSEQEAEEFRDKEKKFQKQVTGRRKSMGEIRDILDHSVLDVRMLLQRYMQDILNNRIQVYYDRGNGYSEEESCYIPDVYTSRDTIEAEIVFDSSVRQIRLDPADTCCTVKILKLDLNKIPVPLQKKTVVTNGRALKTGSFIFDTEDPNINVKVSELPLTGENVLCVKMKIARLSSDIASDLFEGAKKIF